MLRKFIFTFFVQVGQVAISISMLALQEEDFGVPVFFQYV
jgi:hypothetical protein